MTELSQDALAAYGALSPESKLVADAAFAANNINVETAGFKAMAAPAVEQLTVEQLTAKGHSPEWIAAELAHRAAGGTATSAAAAPASAPAAKPITDDLGLSGGPTAGSVAAEIAAATAKLLAAPSAYRLEHSNSNSLTPDELQIQNAELSAGFAEMKLPAASAQNITDAILQNVVRYALPNASENDLKGMFLDQGESLAGMSNKAEIIRLAGVAQDAMSSGFRASLNSKFALHSASALCALSNAGLILELRAKGKTK
jgi:hypothetical protein